MTNSKTKQSTQRQLTVKGAVSSSGKRYITVREGKTRVRFALTDMVIEPKKVRATLANAGIILFGRAYSALQQEVEAIEHFAPKNLLERAGWNGECFGMPDGQVFAPRGHKAVALYPIDRDRCAQAGTLDTWLAKVAEPVAGQTIAEFVLMAAFCGPILRHSRRTTNIGFELVGEKGKGKSTLLYLMASVAGRGVGDIPRYWNTCSTTVVALERKARNSSDMPLILDDATAFAADQVGASRGASFKAFVFNLSHGEVKDRATDDSPQQAYRLLYFITSNLPLSSVLSDVAELEAGAAADRLLTLDLGVRNNRNFDFIPSEDRDGAAYAARLELAIRENHGTAMPHFVMKLVEEHSKSADALRDAIEARVEAFIEHVQADRSDGSAFRVAQAFGLVAAAGRLAKRFGCLPQNFDPERSVTAAYQLFLASTKRVTRRDRLLAYLSRPSFIDIDGRKGPFITDEEFETAPGFIRAHRSGKREHLVRKQMFKSAFPDWKAILRDWGVQDLLIKDPDHPFSGPKRELREGHPNDRFLAFEVSPKAKPRNK